MALPRILSCASSSASISSTGWPRVAAGVALVEYSWRVRRGREQGGGGRRENCMVENRRFAGVFRIYTAL